MAFEQLQAPAAPDAYATQEPTIVPSRPASTTPTIVRW